MKSMLERSFRLGCRSLMDAGIEVVFGLAIAGAYITYAEPVLF